MGDFLYRVMMRLRMQGARRLLWRVVSKSGLLRVVGDAHYFKMKTLALTGEEYAAPGNGGGINSAMLWQHLNWESDIPRICCDKFAVRRHVREIAGERYLVPLLPSEDASWTDADAVPFDELPNGIVLKCNNGSGMNEVIRDWRQVDKPALRRKLRRWLRSDFAKHGREDQYAGMQNRIVCEKMLTGADGSVPMDYKITCSDGRPLFVWVDVGRFAEHKRNVYSPDWEFVNVRINGYPSDASLKIPRPDNWDEMLEVSSKLSKGIPIVRIDLYNVDGRIYFGEMTFTSARMVAKFEPFSFSNEMARKINFPKGAQFK